MTESTPIATGLTAKVKSRLRRVVQGVAREEVRAPIVRLSERLDRADARIDALEVALAAAADRERALKKDLLATNRRIDWLESGGDESAPVGG
jgi:hypothetical protein